MHHQTDVEFTKLPLGGRFPYTVKITLPADFNLFGYEGPGFFCGAQGSHAGISTCSIDVKSIDAYRRLLNDLPGYLNDAGLKLAFSEPVPVLIAKAQQIMQSAEMKK
jgi:hypothetical protein